MIDKPDTQRPNTIFGEFFRGKRIIWMWNVFFLFLWMKICQFVQSGLWRRRRNWIKTTQKLVNATHQTMEKTVKITSKTTNWRTGKARYTFCFSLKKKGHTETQLLFNGSTLIRMKWMDGGHSKEKKTDWKIMSSSRPTGGWNNGPVTKKKEKFGKKSNEKLRSGGQFPENFCLRFFE